MALLDFLQSGSPDASGGLLELLRRSAMQQRLTTPGAPGDVYGASPQPQQQPAYGAAPQAQPAILAANQPSPLDTAQFPAGPVGAPSQAMAYQPQAQPAQQQPTQTLASSLIPQIGSTLASIGNGGGLFSALSGHPNDPKTKALQVGNLTARALIAKGIDPTAAMAAIGNPELLKTLVTQAYGPKKVTPLGEGYVADASGNITRAYEPDDKNKIVKIGQDGMGREQYGVFNPSDGSIKPYTPPGGSAASGGLGNMDLTGKAYLDTLPKAQANIVQSMVEGTIAPPSSFALAKPYWQAMLAAAKNYDPTFDATNWSGRVAGVKDFSAGKSSEMVRSANQTLHHVGSLLDSMDKLKNGSFPAVNYIENKAAEGFGSGAQGAFRTNAHAVAEELSKVFKGSNLSDAEIKSWESNLSENMSPEQQRTQVAKLGELLHGSLQALEEKRLNSIGPIAAAKQGSLIKEEGKNVLDRIQTWTKKNGAATAAPTSGGIQEGATATNPQTGQKLTYRNGQWQ